MPVPYQLTLSAAQRAELVQTRDHAAKAYLRERAAALLKIASRYTLQEAARSGGLKRHHPDTIGAWVHRYEQAGLEGLRIHAGRGRKPAFPPFCLLSRPKPRRAACWSSCFGRQDARAAAGGSTGCGK